MEILVLGSGSKGNSLVVKDQGRAIMVDAGFSRRELYRRMELLGADPDEISGVLLTHEHSDHLAGARVFCDSLNIPLCSASGTLGYLQKRESSGKEHKLPKRLLAFEAGAQFKLGEFEVETFPVQHDAIDPVGFVVHCSGCRIGVATDLGEVNPVVERHLRDCDVLVLESNYDLDMLRNSDRRLELKRRIAGRHGHLDNRDAARALGKLLTPRTSLVLLAHMSSECNQKNLITDLVTTELEKIGRPELPFAILDQNEPLAVCRDASGALSIKNCGVDDGRTA